MDPGPRVVSARSTSSRTVSGLALIAVLAMSGCASTGGPAPTAPHTGSTSDHGLTVELRQNRDQYASRAAIVRISNTGADDIVLTDVELAGTAFDGSTTRERTSTVPTGQTKDLAVELPPADCDATGSALQADVLLRLQDGSVVEARGIPDPTRALPRTHAADCTAASVARIATVAADEEVRLDGTGSGTVAVLTVRVTPTGAPGRLELVSLRSTVLLQPAPTGTEAGAPAEEWPLDLVVDAATGPRTVELRIVPTRCDPHALAEDKVGTLFPLVVRVDGGEEAVLTLPLSSGTADALKDAVRLRCA